LPERAWVMRTSSARAALECDVPYSVAVTAVRVLSRDPVYPAPRTDGFACA
jgi:hypothetical protein